MAGKVVKLLVAVSDQVEPGTPMIVFEGMKMENELIAKCGGMVTQIPGIRRICKCIDCP